MVVWEEYRGRGGERRKKKKEKKGRGKREIKWEIGRKQRETMATIYTPEIDIYL